MIADLPPWGLARPGVVKFLLPGFLATLASVLPKSDIVPWEVGGGRAARQPGQDRKVAAPTSQARVARPASRLVSKRYWTGIERSGRQGPMGGVR